MPSFGSSSIPNNLVFTDVTYITGPTGPTGATGATGSSIRGATGLSGPEFKSSNIFGNTFGVTYGITGYFLGITAPSGSSQKLTNPNFIIGETGGIESVSFYAGPSLSNNYGFQFKTIILRGEVTGGISLDSFYINSTSTGNTLIGNTGSIFYVGTETSGFGTQIQPTTDTITNYTKNIITPVVGSLFGITLDTFRFKISQHLDTMGNTSGVINQNIITLTGISYATDLNRIKQKYGITYSIVNGTNTVTRTDQGLFTTFIFRGSSSSKATPMVSFRAEGITLFGKVTGPVEIKMIGDEFDYSTRYTTQIMGSCCYCSPDVNGEEITVHRDCIDYASQSFCNSINGSFSFSPCSDRYLTNDCYSGGVCCVNGTCLETDRIFCSKVFGKFYANIKCGDLPYGCATNCPLEASCCVNGSCLSIASGENNEQFCKELKGTYKEVPCSDRNCCVEGFRGACCVGSDICIDDTTPLECKERDGVFQGPTSICTASTCCRDSDSVPSLKSLRTENNQILPDLKVGDYFAGGIVAGFVGYPSPIGFDPEGVFATGEIISDLENEMNPNIQKYVAVNGAFNFGLKCNCSNYSPSRYIDTLALGQNNGRSVLSEIKSLSGIKDEYRLSFFNRMSDTCLPYETKQCNDNGETNKKYGFNSISAYKKAAKQIHGTDIPNGWILIVSPEDFYENESYLSFGMSMGVNGFNVPSNMTNYSNLLWQNNVIAPYGTTVFDGLVNTRLFDDTSIDRNTWFISSTYMINQKLQQFDPLAYYRFKHTHLNYWNDSVDQNLLSRNPDYFKEQYRQLWSKINTENTALYNISKSNKENYNGYSDWYIPSALELNMIYNNMNKINAGILLNDRNSGWNLLSKDSTYWSSTTGGKVKSIKNNKTKYYEQSNQVMESIIANTGDSLLDSWRRLKLGHAHRAFAQQFATGNMVSYLKTEQSAKLRACRMIPTYFKNQDLTDQFEFSFKSLGTCSSCK